MMAHNITLIPGDGIGPEVTEATRRVLEATGVSFNWEVAYAGDDAQEKYGTPLPDYVLESIRKNKVALKGPVTTPSAPVSGASMSPCARSWTSTPACAPARSTPASPTHVYKMWISSSSGRTPKTSTPASSSKKARRRRPS